jgi:flagellar protein FliS
MSTSTAQDNYLRSAVESASPIGLTIMLYDRLVTDLRVAVEAIRNSDIEKRCAQINHALLVLNALEGQVDPEHGGDTAARLTQFYGVVRNQCVIAQTQNAPEILEKQIELILQVREAWHQVESRPAPAAVQGQAATLDPYSSSGPAAMAQNTSEDRPSSSWTA